MIPTQEPPGHPRRWAILGVLVISLLLVIMDNTILNVALKTLADPVHGLGADQAELEWSMNAYALAFAAPLLSFGVLGDRYGRRRLLLIGLALFGAASLASAYARDPGQLVAARAFMGVGAAAVTPATLAIISNVFDARERARAIAVWSGAVGLAIALGPILGGVLLEHFWWGAVFLINVPVVLLGLVGAVLLIPESRAAGAGRLDPAGVLLATAGLTVLVYGIIDGGEHGFGARWVWAWLAGGVVLLAAFVWWERRTPSPLLDLRLFADARFSAANAAIGLIFFAVMGMIFFLPFYLQLVRGYSALDTGLLLLPLAVAQLAFAPVSAAAVRRFGANRVCAAGLTMIALTMIGFAVIEVDTPIPLITVYFFCYGVGMANVMPPAMESIMAAVTRTRAGLGSAVANSVRQVAGALGVAVIGSVVAAVYRDGIGPTADTLPPPAADAVRDSVAGAYGLSGRLGAMDQRVVDAANEAFVDGLRWAALGSAGVALAAALMVLLWLPGRPSPVIKGYVARHAEPVATNPLITEKAG